MNIQRNIANQVNPNDSNVMSVIEDAVLFQKVEYIVVCGHTNCGGVNASCSQPKNLDKSLEKYLEPVRDLFQKVRKELKGEENCILDVMYKENVKKQIQNLMEIDIVKNAVDSGKLTLIPMIFKLDKGILEEI